MAKWHGIELGEPVEIERVRRLALPVSAQMRISRLDVAVGDRVTFNGRPAQVIAAKPAPDAYGMSEVEIRFDE